MVAAVGEEPAVVEVKAKRAGAGAAFSAGGTETAGGERVVREPRDGGAGG